MLNYGLVSTAIADDRQKLQDGVRRLGTMAHKYGIPITWATDAASAQFLAKDVTEWHVEYGDEPLLMLNIKPLWETTWATLTGNDNSQSAALNTAQATESPEVIAEHLVRMRELLPQYVTTECDKLKKAIAWAVPSVAGAVWKNRVLLHALEQTGFRGLWGYRWDARDSDADADRGCPFGYFYPSAEQHNFSAPAAGNIAGIPYLTAAHVENEADNFRASLLKGTAQRSYDVYVENQQWNRWLGYVQHIDALEVTQFGQETLERLEAYFAHVVNSESIRLLPLSEMVDDYWTNCQQTEPTYVIANGPECQTMAESQNSDPNTTSKTGEQNRFFYYDAECQLTFVEGTVEPVEMKNYISPPVLDTNPGKVSQLNAPIHGTEYYLPKLARFLPSRQRSKLHITFAIESTKAMPYGIAIWGNHSGLQLATANVDAVTWIDKYMLFVRFSLEPGNNEFEVILTI